MKHCPHCGRPTPERARTCAGCGGDLPASEDLVRTRRYLSADLTELGDEGNASTSPPPPRIEVSGSPSQVPDMASEDGDYFAAWLRWDVPASAPARGTPESEAPDLGAGELSSDAESSDGLIDAIVGAEEARLAGLAGPERGGRAPRAKAARGKDSSRAPARAASSLAGLSEFIDGLDVDASPGAYGAARAPRAHRSVPAPGRVSVSPPRPDARRPDDPTIRAAWDAGRRAGLAEAAREVRRILDQGGVTLVDLFALEETISRLAAPEGSPKKKS